MTHDEEGRLIETRPISFENVYEVGDYVRDALKLAEAMAHPRSKVPADERVGASLLRLTLLQDETATLLKELGHIKQKMMNLPEERW